MLKGFRNTIIRKFGIFHLISSVVFVTCLMISVLSIVLFTEGIFHAYTPSQEWEGKTELERQLELENVYKKYVLKEISQDEENLSYIEEILEDKSFNCFSCGGMITDNEKFILKNRVFVKCPYCRSIYQVKL